MTDQKIPEGYTGLYLQAEYATKECVGPILGMNFIPFMSSKGAAPVFSARYDNGVNKESLHTQVYFCPEFSARLMHAEDRRDESDYSLEITVPLTEQGEQTAENLERDLLKTFPEFMKLRSEKRGVRHPSECRPCF